MRQDANSTMEVMAAVTHGPLNTDMNDEPDSDARCDCPTDAAMMGL